MQVITDLRENKCHSPVGLGAYEWWYFDGIDADNEYSFVIMFLAGNPFSPQYNSEIKNHLKGPKGSPPHPQDYSSVSINIYLNGRVVYRVIYDYSKKKFRLLNEGTNEKVFLGKSSFYFDPLEKKFFLNISLSSFDIKNKFKAEYIFTPKNESRISATNSKGEKHFWLPAAPVCDVKGKFKVYKNFKRKKTDFVGLGYHHHCWGEEAMFKTISSWNWGRMLSDEYCVVFYYALYKQNSSNPFKKLLIYKSGKLIHQSDNFEIKLKNSRNYLLLRYNNQITMKSGDFEIRVETEKKIDNGPFYIRFLSRFFISQNGTVIADGSLGISEFMNTKRLESEILKPFANLRTRRTDEPEPESDE